MRRLHFDDRIRGQLSLRAIFKIVTAAACTAALARAIGWLAIAVPIGAVIVAVARVSPREKSWWMVAAAAPVISAIVVSHAMICPFVYETLGEVRMGFCYVMLMLYLVPFTMLMRHRGILAVCVSIGIWLFCVPPQLIWAWRLGAVRQEVANIVTFTEDVKRRTGQYPESLATYVWSDPSCRDFIKYDVTENADRIVYFWSGNRNAPHWHSSNSGWGYYPD